MKIRPIRILVILAPILVSCEMFYKPVTPPGYAVHNPEKVFIDDSLAEVSGLFYLPKERKFLAITDEEAIIYEMDSSGTGIRYRFPQPFGEHGDFEEVIMVDTTIFALLSNGNIYAIDRQGRARLYKFDGHKNDDFESLYYEPSTNSLISICKECDHEDETRARTAYRFSLANMQFEPGKYYEIPTRDVADILKDGVAAFNPSAAAIHPIEKKLYILSSAGNLLVITDLKGKVESVYRINPDLYPQAEGIAFAPNGDMFITNEAKLGKPSLMIMPYKP